MQFYKCEILLQGTFYCKNNKLLKNKKLVIFE